MTLSWEQIDAAFTGGSTPPVEGMRQQWGFVTQINPLRVQLDGDEAPLDITPDTTVSGLHVGARVRAVLYCGTITIDGRVDGDAPMGAVMQWLFDEAPPGWLMARGQRGWASEYPVFAARLGTRFGGTIGDPAMPNLQGRVPVGQDPADGSFGSVGNSGGEKYHTLTATEMPSHAHGQDPHSHYVAVGSMWYNDGGANNIASGTSTRRTTITNPGTSSAQPAIWAAGGGGSHNNMQPYLVVNYIVKAA